MPLQRELAAELTKQLLPEFGDPDSLMVGWDYTQVGILQEDKNAEWERLGKAYASGGLKRSEYREGMGYEFDEAADDVYYMPKGGALLSPDEHEAMSEQELSALETPLSLVKSKRDALLEAGEIWWKDNSSPESQSLLSATEVVKSNGSAKPS
jgi:hypothetical protein